MPRGTPIISASTRAASTTCNFSGLSEIGAPPSIALSEKITSYEVGFKSELADRRVALVHHGLDFGGLEQSLEVSSLEV